VFGILRPAAHIERIEPSLIKRTYRYWQLRILSGMYLGYVVYYFTRKNLPIALPSMMNELGFSMTDFGWVLTTSSLAYGISKFTSGILSDRSNPRYFMAIGLIITGILNVLFGMSSSLVIFAVIWGLNGWFQGCGWPPCSRLLTHWYGRQERARWWAVWNTSHNLGGFLIPLITIQLINAYSNWRLGLYIPGLIGILAGFLVMNRLRDTPQSLGLPSIEEYSKESTTSDGGVDPIGERELTTRELLFKYVLGNPFLWLLAAAYFFLYFVRQAVNDWSLIYLTQAKGYGTAAAALCVGLFEIGGLFGSLASGWISDVIFRGKRGPVSVLFALAVVGSVAAFWMIPSGNIIAVGAAVFAVGFFVYGPQMLIGIAAAELAHKKAAATATGFAGFFAYLGAATAGAPIAQVAEVHGWNAFFGTIIACGLLVVALLLPLWSKTERRVAVTA
jgi:MFS transporter, OPA family, sugar phosphate sensor protein UhpC